MILNRVIQQAVNNIADELGIPRHVATVAYRSSWLFIKNTIENLPDLESISEQEFNTLQVNFNIPSLGKYTSNYNKIKRRNKFKQIVNERNKIKAD